MRQILGSAMPPRRGPRLTAIVSGIAALTLAVGGGCSGDDSLGQVDGETLRGSVILHGETWRCTRPVSLDLVRVDIRGASKDAVHLNKGCTGTIRRLEIVGDGERLGTAADGVKVHAGSRDLEILEGIINCGRKKPRKHQDAIQVMGGKRVTFHNISSRGCSNSFMFINHGRNKHETPEDVVCHGCRAWTRNYSVSIVNAIRSGAVNGHFVSRASPRASDHAVDPVLTGNEWTARPFDEIDAEQEREREARGESKDKAR